MSSLICSFGVSPPPPPRQAFLLAWLLADAPLWTWIWGLRQEVKLCRNLVLQWNGHVYATIQSKPRNSTDFCRSVDLWSIQFQLSGHTINPITMWDRISVQPDFRLGNPKSTHTITNIFWLRCIQSCCCTYMTMSSMQDKVYRQRFDRSSCKLCIDITANLKWYKQ